MIILYERANKSKLFYSLTELWIRFSGLNRKNKDKCFRMSGSFILSSFQSLFQLV